MKITDKIEGYENMSAEEKLKALEGFEVEEPNTSEVTKLKEALNKASSEASNYKKQLKEKQLINPLWFMPMKRASVQCPPC